MPECVYGCRHPLWGGAGTCLQRVDPTDYECSCDDGFRSTDSFGSPSCVSKHALAAVYISVAVYAAATLLFLQWTAMKQRHLSTAAQASRRAVLRLRLIRSVSVYSGSTSIVFSVAAGHGTLYSIPLQILYTISMPVITMSAAHMIDLWIDTLPKQLMPADGMAIKVIALAEKKNMLVWVGRVALVGLAPLSFLTFIVLDTIKVVRAINLVTATAAVLSVICFNFVGFHLTGVINNARRQASPSAKVFYGQAVHTLWVQVIALSCAGILFMAMGLAVEPLPAGVGARTPIIPLSIMVLDGLVGLSLAVHFARIAPGSGVLSSSRPASPMVSQNKSMVPSRGIRGQISEVVAKIKAATPAGPRVIPTTGEEC